MEQLELLWKLQETDLAIVELEDKIENNPLSINVRAAQERLEETKTILEQETRRQMEQTKLLKSLELDLNKTIDDRANLHKKLYGGEISNVRELKSMGKRLESLEAEQEALEGKILEGMEETEIHQQGLDDLKDRISQRQREKENEEAKLNRELAELNTQLDTLQKKRCQILPQIETKYLDLYRTQCRRHQGRGISRAINDTCEGCRVFISSAQRGLLYNPSALVYCENCGRLLVRFFEESGED